MSKNLTEKQKRDIIAQENARFLKALERKKEATLEEKSLEELQEALKDLNQSFVK